MVSENKSDAAKAIAEIADKKGVTVKEVKDEIKSAIAIGMSSEDPKIKKEWEDIPHKGKKPTPEEVIDHLSKVVDSNIS